MSMKIITKIVTSIMVMTITMAITIHLEVFVGHVLVIIYGHSGFTWK